MSDMELSSVQNVVGPCFGPAHIKRLHRTNSTSVIFKDKTNGNKGRTFKPKGLWYSFGESWLDWVKDEMPHWEDELFKNCFELQLITENILVLDKNNILSFTEEYKTKYGVHESFIMCIDWERVANDYHGIETPKYLYDFRFHDTTHWYYSWDCASGCVWNKEAVEAITRLD